MMRYSRRHVIKQGAVLSVAGAAAACSSSSTVTTTSAAVPFQLRIAVHGAYALVKRTSGGLTVASLAHPQANPCTYDYSKHAMLIALRQGTVDAGGTSHKSTVTNNIENWTMSGPVTVVSGATPGVVKLPAASAETYEFEPFAPSNPANEWAWNDHNYVPSLGKAPDWRKHADATFDLPAGTLRVLPPPNAYARIGRWRWEHDAKRVHALSDMVVLETTGTDALTLRSQAGDIKLTPQKGVVSIEITSDVDEKMAVINAGDPMEHLALLYDFVDASLGCNARPVPKYEVIPGRPPLDPSKLTPGVECPLAFIEE